MILTDKTGITIILAVLFVLGEHVSKIDTLTCKNSVVFHWRETGEKRETEKKNWNKLEKEFTGNKSKLSLFLNPNTTFGFRFINVPGRDPCCWEVYPEEKYKGEPVQLLSKITNGFGGIPGFPRFKANSLKKIPCE